MKPPSSTGMRRLREVLGFGILAALIVVLVRSWDEARTVILQPAGTLVGAGLLLVVGALAASRAWASLVAEQQPAGRAMSAFLAAQPAKYLPAGAAFQAITQVGLSVGPEGRRGPVSASYVAFLLVQLVAGMVVGSMFAFTGTGLGAWARAASALGILSVAALRRGWMTRGMRLLARILRRIAPADLIPTQRAIHWAFFWALAPVVLSGAALGLILDGSLPGSLRAIPAFAAAWVLGFVTVPIPSGLGVREAMLVVLLPAYPSSAVLAASIVHRLITLAAEVILLAAVWKRTFVPKTE
jgi:hypothetical protein